MGPSSADLICPPGESLAEIDLAVDAHFQAFAETFGLSVDQAIRADSQNHYYSWKNGPYAKLLLEPRFVEFVERVLAEPNASPPS